MPSRWSAITEFCGKKTRRAGVSCDCCLLAYAAAAADGSEGDGFKLSAGDMRDQELADLARALAERTGQSLCE
jgi:hypothetical protein